MKRRLLILPSLLLAAMLVQGCSPRKLAVPDEPVGAPDSFVEAPGEAVPSPEVGLWWKDFGDEDLNSLVDEAFRNNTGVLRAYERLEQTRAVTRATGASRWMTLDVGARGGRARQLGITADSYRLSAAASYEIDLWKRLSSRTEAARLDSLASLEDLKSLHISLSAEVVDLYYFAVEQRAQIELADRTIEAFEDTLERVESRYREGLVPALDVYQSRQNLASARAERTVFESRLASAEHALSVLLGRVPVRGLAGPGARLAEPPRLSPGLPSELITRRPDVRAALLRVEAGDRRVAAAVADRFPSFSLVGEYGGASSSLGSILDSPNIFWNTLLSAALPVIDGGRRSAEVERTEAVYRELLIGYREAVLVSLREVEDALSSGRATEERIRMLEERVSASESALRLALDRYLQGLSDYLPVLTEQQRLYESRSALIAARRQLISDRIALLRSLGGGWTDSVVSERLEGGKNRKEARK